jgi:hypothetical protein
MTPMVLILIVVFVVAPIAAAMAKRLESGAGQARLPEGADPERIAQIEGQIEALVDQVQELAEHQEFLTRLLEENTESGRPALTEDGDR